jgi:hypothetical protein
MEDGVSKRTNLIAAVFAFVYLFAAHAIIFLLDNTTLRTGDYIAVSLLEYVVQASVIIGKLLVQISAVSSYY